MFTINLLKKAELEMNDACNWYEKKRTGLGAQFLEKVNEGLSLIEVNPYLYSNRYNNGLRFAPLKIFPYLIVYWIDENQSAVFVISIFHTSRDPAQFYKSLISRRT